MTAAIMRQMMEGVVLFGTARRAILDGYTSAGKTGTAQKVDPATGRYSHTNYVASFAGFAPVNNPAISVIVVIDSAKGLHQGGQVSAPVFSRIAQQVLAYMHVPHDVDSKNDKLRMMQAKAKPDDIDEEPQEHLGEPLVVADEQSDVPAKPTATKVESVNSGSKMPAIVAKDESQPALPVPENPVQPSGTMVLDVGGGPTVPSFIGKSKRAAIEMAQTSGIELNAIGSGTATEQSPAPGARMPAGGRVAVRFSR
jgi:cell division protein FtsI (penicillin-binding protein 3)